jgi:cytochrome c oxidase cbb3-type subunit 3
MLKTSRRSLVLSFLCGSGLSFAGTQPSDEINSGESVYRYYCYQCHAYSGNGRTMASTFLNPTPRDFTANASKALDDATMVDAVTNGRLGTAMPSFSSVLKPDEIEAVISYVRTTFMETEPASINYHSAVNGWNDRASYRVAYDFVNESIRLNTPTELLTESQLRGRSIYLSACISCHEQSSNGEDDVVWELRAVSYPRRHFSHRAEEADSGPIDALSSASPYTLHDQPVIPSTMTPEVARGMGLYQANCAFCHALDGTGRNWIGSFLEPKPRDFTSRNFVSSEASEELRERVRNGIPNTSMPAWKYVLDDEEINSIIAYINAAFRP